MPSPTPPISQLVDTFNIAASRVPAYKRILAESGIGPEDIKTIDDFERLPILDKYKTFQRFSLSDLHLDGKIGPVGEILPSSGASGVFSFGLYSPSQAQAHRNRLDEAFDAIFQVSTRKSLLLNCMPMGVKLHSKLCTLAETSVRADMACALVDALGDQHDQILLIGETAFIKHVLETGIDSGIDWRKHLVHLIIGGEMVAENARKYFESILSTAPADIEKGLIGCSMGAAELGLNLFADVPPIRPIILLRRALHENRSLAGELLGPDATTAPALFSYDPARAYVEFVDGRMVVTMLDPNRPIPMIRYAPGDYGFFLELPERVRPWLDAMGVDTGVLDQLPVIAIWGRGQFAKSGSEGGRVYPEQIKEGIYHNGGLARLATANFRLSSGDDRARVRIQLVPGVDPSERIRQAFAEAISCYVTWPLEVSCQRYEAFGSGMSLDYEVKFEYISTDDQVQSSSLSGAYVPVTEAGTRDAVSHRDPGNVRPTQRL